MGKIRRERQKFHITSTPSDTPAAPNEVPKYKPIPVKLQPTENIFAGININLEKVAKLPADNFAEPKVKPRSQPATDNNKGENKSKDTVDGKKPIQPEKHLTKKEKLKLKHEKLLAKIDVIQQAKQRVKEKRLKKQKNKEEKITPLTLLSAEAVKASGSSSSVGGAKKKFGDLNMVKEALLSLNDSLPALDSVYKYKSKEAKTGLETDDSNKNPKKKSGSGAKGVQKKKDKKKKKGNPSKDFVKSYEYFRKLVADKTYKENPRAVIALHIKNKLRAQK